VAQSEECLTLDFNSGHGLGGCGLLSPMSGSILSVEFAWDFPSPALKINKILKKNSLGTALV